MFIIVFVAVGRGFLIANVTTQTLHKTLEFRYPGTKLRVDSSFSGMSSPWFSRTGNALQIRSRALATREEPIAFDLLPLAGLAREANVLLLSTIIGLWWRRFLFLFHV
jgi:hypothetical protein